MFVCDYLWFDYHLNYPSDQMIAQSTLVVSIHLLELKQHKPCLYQKACLSPVPPGTMLPSRRTFNCGYKSCPILLILLRSGWLYKTFGYTWRLCLWEETLPSNCLKYVAADNHIQYMHNTNTIYISNNILSVYTYIHMHSGREISESITINTANI